jgi:hypothetical protein
MIVDDEIKQVNPSKWESMTFSELLEEKNILMDRYYYALSINANYAKAILNGIDRINSYLDKFSK